MTLAVDQKFELALALSKLDGAFEIAQQVGMADTWKLFGDIALSRGLFLRAEN